MSLPKAINCPRIDVDSKECPQALRIALRADIRSVFKLRREFSDKVLSNKALDVFIDGWWKNHHNLIRAASIRDEWSWATLSLNFDENVMRPVNFFAARKDYLCLLARPCYLDGELFAKWAYAEDRVVNSNPSYNFNLGMIHNELYVMFVTLFNKVILEDKVVSADTVYTDEDSKLSVAIVEEIKQFISEHTEEEDKRSIFCRRFSELFGVDFVPFNKIPKFLYDYAVANRLDFTKKFDEFIEFFKDNRANFMTDVCKAIGAHQVCGSEGPVKTTLTNKLVKCYYDWLTALSIGYPGNQFEITDEQPDFDTKVRRLKDNYKFYTDMMLKVRNGDGGFNLVNYGTFEQIFARLQENVRGATTRESFIVSFHPCDMITCSLGYNWSSCQSFINKFDDFPDGYGRGASYSGTYNRGNFQFVSGNGFIAYVPYEKLPNVPQYLWAKRKRCLLWIGNDLNCLRQNFFYPGRDTDQETLAFAKVIREYLQNVCAPFNFSNGTMDWKSSSKRVRHTSNLDESGFEKFVEIYTPLDGRYDDPILTASYLNNDDEKKLIYAADFPAFDTGRIGNRFFQTSGYVCPICGKRVSEPGPCDKCRSEMIEHKGNKYHPSDLVQLKTDDGIKYFALNELDQLDGLVLTEDGTHVPFKSAYKVFMPSGIKYFKVLPDYVKQCKVCNEYFHPSFMVGGVCVDHINTVLDDNLDIEIDFDVVMERFLNGNLSFACNNPVSLEKLLHLLDEKKVKWQSGKLPSEFIPSSRVSLGRYLSCDKGILTLSSHAKSSVVKLTKLFKKGGN